MKFAAPFKHNSPIEPDEYDIEFTKHSEFDTLIDFISSHKDKHINIHFQKDIDIEKMIIINKISDNIYIRIDPKDINIVSRLKQNNIRFIFNYSMPINSYGLLDWALQIQPASMYIADDLLYNLINVKTQCDSAGVELRIILNRIPVTNPFSMDSKLAPIYRPQDFNLLNDYFSVGEFDCYDDNGHYDWIKSKTQYEKWFVNHFWEDDLRFLNKDVSFNIMCPCVPPELAQYRSSCSFACRSHGVSHCNKCDRLYHFAQRNFENNIGYKINTTTGLPTKEELFKILEEQEKNNVQE